MPHSSNKKGFKMTILKSVPLKLCLYGSLHLHFFLKIFEVLFSLIFQRLDSTATILRAKFTINSIYCTLQFQYWCFVYAVRFGPLTFYPSSRSKWIFYFAEKSQSISEWHHLSHVTIGRTWYIELRRFSTVCLDIMFLVIYRSLQPGHGMWGSIGGETTKSYMFKG